MAALDPAITLKLASLRLHGESTVGIFSTNS
jgi:hypothetical protein